MIVTLATGDRDHWSRSPAPPILLPADIHLLVIRWGGSHELLQLQQQVGGRCPVRCGGMGTLSVATVIRMTDGGQSLMTLSCYTRLPPIPSTWRMWYQWQLSASTVDNSIGTTA